MTAVRLQSGRIWIHSPVRFSNKLASAVSKIGPLGFIVAPNTLHYVHAKDWAATHPSARVLCVDGNSSKLAPLNYQILRSMPSSQPCELEYSLVHLGAFEEAIFFHRSSRTLIVTDLMQNFEARRVRYPLIRFLLKIGGATGPNGRPSLELRLAARKYREEMREAVRTMLEWEPKRIILSHGRCYETDAVAEIKRAFISFTRNN